MSRHFNYELDERKIKALLKENHLSFSENVWDEYLSEHNSAIKPTKIPVIRPISFSINKNMVLGTTFIVLICSFTFLIARFINFNQNKTSGTETVREVKPDPNKYKFAKATPPKKETVKSEPKLIVAAQKDTVNELASLSDNTPTLALNPDNISSNSAVKTQTENNTVARVIKDSSNSSLEITKNNNSTTKSRKKHSRKKQAETLETKPLTTELPVLTTEEPELQLR